MRRNFLYCITLTFVFLVTACKDDEEKATIVGKWEGDQSEIQFTPTGSPVAIYNETDDDFDAILEFQNDNVVTLISGSQTSTGSYEVKGDKLITTIRFGNELIDLSGTFTIKRLSQTTLELYIEDEREVSVPDYGTFSGKIKATFKFNRVSN